jgi:hypothetical protein
MPIEIKKNIASRILFTKRSHQRLQPPHSENSARELRQQPSTSPPHPTTRARGRFKRSGSRQQQQQQQQRRQRHQQQQQH